MIRPSPKLSARSNYIALFCVAGALIVFVAGLTWFVLKQSHDDAAHRVRTSSLVLAKSLEQTLQSQLDSVNLVLQVAANEISRMHSKRRINAKEISDFLNLQRKEFGHVTRLRGTNKDGDVIYGIDDLSAPLNVADRKYFKTLKHDAKQGMFINALVVSRTSGKWIWVFARRINADDGRFLGIVYGLKTVASINRLFAQLRPQAGNQILLRTSDRRLVAGYIAPDRYFFPDEQRAITAAQEKALQENQEEGYYLNVTSDVDGITRDHVYRRNAQYGFMVDVGVDDQVAYSSWYRQAVVIGIFSLASSLVLIVAAVFLARSWQRQAKDMQALASSKALLEESQKIASIGSYVYDLKKDTWAGTGAISEMFGLAPDFPHDGRGWLALMQPAHRKALRTRLREVLNGRGSFEEVYAITSPKDGETHWLLQRALTRFDENGKPVAIVGTVQDVTERKVATDALRDSHEILQSILDTTQDAVWRLDGEGNILEVNQACCEMTGYAREELLTMHVYDAAVVSSKEEVAARLREVAARGQALFESQLRHKDGRVVDVEVSASCREVPGGEIVAFMRDITERKRAEDELQHMATTDGLTGVFNRRHFTLLASRECTRALRMKEALSLAIIDIDHFKDINDRFGHAAGDHAMLELVNVFKENIRQIDIFARLGGDEFVLLLPGSTPEQAVDVLKRIQAAMKSRRVETEDVDIYFTVSAGVTGILLQDDTLDNMLARADQALYESKEAGRDCVSYV